MSNYTCDGCGEEFHGERVVFTTEATDATGLDVTVTKRWTTCPDCADQLFARIGRKAPWDDGDATVMAMPDDDDQVAAPLGGVSGPIGE